ncbi:MAG: hypothetical protein HKM93_05465 [Desulfobacteraceae bacterium]|nr:hypothetical protein [Desulfobacteraceae bacterium]
MALNINQQLAGTTLIVDEMPGRINGDDENPPGRILHLDAAGRTVWETTVLKMPYDAIPLEDGTYLANIIRDKSVWQVARDGQRILRISVGGYPCSTQLLATGDILVAGWDYDLPGFVRQFDSRGHVQWCCENLKWPWKAERLDSGNTLIADAGNRRVFEVDMNGETVWEVDGLGPESPALWESLGPVYCQRLADHNTLVSIRGLSRVVELDASGRIVWEIDNRILKQQYSAVRLKNNNTLIADGGNFRVIEVNPQKQIVWEMSDLGYPAKAYRFK